MGYVVGIFGFKVRRTDRTKLADIVAHRELGEHDPAGEGTDTTGARGAKQVSIYRVLWALLCADRVAVLGFD